MKKTIKALALLAMVGTALSTTVASAEDRFLCNADEQVIFGCNSSDDRSDKVISLCASTDVSASGGYMQYRFGSRNNIELTYPESLEPPSGYFWHSTNTYAGGGYSDRVRFKNGKVQYVVFEDMISTGPNSPKEVWRGVGILRPGKKTISRLCDGAGSLDDGSAEGFAVPVPDFDAMMDKEEFNFDLELHQ